MSSASMQASNMTGTWYASLLIAILDKGAAHHLFSQRGEVVILLALPQCIVRMFSPHLNLVKLTGKHDLRLNARVGQQRLREQDPVRGVERQLAGATCKIPDKLPILGIIGI